MVNYIHAQDASNAAGKHVSNKCCGILEKCYSDPVRVYLNFVEGVTKHP